MYDFSSADLMRAIRDDAPMQDWIADCLGLPPAQLSPAPPMPMAEALPPALPTLTMLSHGGVGTWMVHLVVGAPGRLARGAGHAATRRAAFIRESVRDPDRWDFRVALLATEAQVTRDWALSREFPHWVDADVLGHHLRRVLAA